ncbi:MAG: hypothetical protein AB7O73_07495, partial [Bacteroidia bacterium]
MAQSAVGTWEDHVSLNNCVTVAEMGGKIYSSNFSSVIIYDKDDGTYEKLNKSNGLSDVGILFMLKNDNNNKIIVVYENSNIDVIYPDGKTANFPDIFRKNYSGKKNINSIIFKNNLAYLSCGFGIAVFDTEKLEIKDTYIIGPGGSNLEVVQLAANDSMFYAATPNGLLKCNYVKTIPNDFNSWSKAGSNLPNGYFGHVVNYNNTIIAGYSPFKQSAIGNQDTLYQFTNGAWSVFPYLSLPYHIKKLKVTGSLLYIIDQFGSLFLNENFNNVAYITQYQNKNASPNDAMRYNNLYWIADQNYGLLYTAGSSPFYEQKFISVNGTNRSLVSNIDFNKDRIVVAPAHVDQGGGATYSKEGVNILEDNEWRYLRKEGTPEDSITDLVWAYFDRKDKSRLWVSSWIFGLMEFKNDNLIKVYNG